MTRLPKTLSKSLRLRLESALEAGSLIECIRGLISEILVELGADDAVVYFKSRLTSAEKDLNPRDAESYSFVVGNSRGNMASPLSGQFLESWHSSGIHDNISQDLQNSFHPVSYSAFSWPYPHIVSTSSESKRKKYILPPDYSLLVPISSEQVVSVSGDAEFNGYIVFLYSHSPPITDDLVQLVISLCPLLSEILAAEKRKELLNTKGLLAIYAHEVKHFLLVARELLSSLEASGTKDTCAVVGRLRRFVNRLELHTNAISLEHRSSNGELLVSPICLSVNELLEEVIQEIKAHFNNIGISLTIDCKDNLHECMLDPAIFPSVILNLLDNAAKFSLVGSSVSIRTYLKDSQTIGVEVINKCKELPEIETSRLGEKYVRGKNSNNISGCGLGLYISRKIVELHGGTLAIDFDDAGNCKVLVCLPVVEGHHSVVSGQSEFRC